jgi:hypothetical protein
MFCKTAAEMVSATGRLVTKPDAAVMLVVPAAAPVANPAELIVAVAGVEETQVTVLVRLAVVLSL